MVSVHFQPFTAKLSISTATPFFPNLAAQGLLDYPLFGMSLTRNESGTLTIGAIDSSVVTNASKIVWNEVVPFAPFPGQGNSSSYLQWVIRLSSFTVSQFIKTHLFR